MERREESEQSKTRTRSVEQENYRALTYAGEVTTMVDIGDLKKKGKEVVGDVEKKGKEIEGETIKQKKITEGEIIKQKKITEGEADKQSE
jgi:hypothetical protein